MADLTVELYGVRVGTLVGASRTFDFTATTDALGVFGIDSPILSVAVPLVAVPIRAKKDRRRNFFRELLPEGQMLTRMAQRASLDEQDVIGLLRIHGRDIAGALQIWDPDVPGEPKQPDLEALTMAQVAELLTHVQDNPLGNKPVGGKTSLAGVQDKIVLASTQGGWARVIDGYPSTHILKPASSAHPTTIYDEEFGARIARAVGLSSYRTWIEDFDAISALVIERYDRSPNVPHGRIHQEDFNQVLGAGGDQKYQKYGGRVSLKRIAKVLTAIGDRHSLDQLLRSTALSVAVGNLDMHAKNLSLLHYQDGSAALAPAYDVVPQVHLPNDGEMALAVDNEYDHKRITRAHLIAEARMWGHSAPAQIVDDTIAAVLEVVASQTPHPNAYPHLVDDITRFAENLAAGREAGAS